MGLGPGHLGLTTHLYENLNLESSASSGPVVMGPAFVGKELDSHVVQAFGEHWESTEPSTGLPSPWFAFKVVGYGVSAPECLVDLYFVGGTASDLRGVRRHCAVPCRRGHTNRGRLTNLAKGPVAIDHLSGDQWILVVDLVQVSRCPS
jgi:hypothetical protein